MCDYANQCRAKQAGRPRPSDCRDVFPCRKCGHQDTQANS